ncbi:unnamed protein product [Arctia plantaginis]|uniref:Uncharacterized protein n=1 Tax=Arctia plantaginis TaxID=874455 RepID=A0A8S1A332_ARCPL|nr:unnamed protein product [Arctia plantaginis]
MVTADEPKQLLSKASATWFKRQTIKGFDSRETTRAVVKERGARTAATFGRMRDALPLTSHRVADLLSETR